MPIKEDHPDLRKPEEKFSLWRYMDIPAFLSLLTKRSLTFVRADLFEDKYEGKLPKETAELIDNEFEKQFGKFNDNNPQNYKKFSELLDNQNKDVYLNCWCKESHEMVNMWKIYSKTNGIAIETTYDKLKKAIISDESVYPINVQYLDYDRDQIDWNSNALTAFTIKRKEYKSENEFRLIIFSPKIIMEKVVPAGHSGEIDHIILAKLYAKTPVIECSVDLDELILKIHLSPYAPSWYFGVLNNVTKKFGLGGVSIIQSNL